MADYVIFLARLYSIIFQCWSCTHNSNQNCVSSTWSFSKKIIESVTPDLNVMEFPLCSVCCCLAHPNELAWQITPHNAQRLVSWSCTCTSMYVCVCTPLLFRRRAVASKLTFLDCRKTNKAAKLHVQWFFPAESKNPQI